MPPESKAIKARCDKCGGHLRNHQVILDHTESWPDDGGPRGCDVYETVKCLGCETVRFRHYMLSEDERDPETGEPSPYHIAVYPESHEGRRRHASFGDPTADAIIPMNVFKIYRETVDCFNVNAKTLAGGGLRAIVEAICKDQGIKGANLEKKIDALVSKGLLAKPQADLLHEERYIGNAALHEMATPTKEDIEDGLTIMEGLINAIYVLPKRAERLRKKRENKHSN